ncbi:MAG: GntR family transcriptional regulator, partial [Bacillota bacterium]
LAWGHRTFEALAADDRRAEYLDLPPGAPVFYIQQVVYLADGTAVEYSDVWLRGDRFRLSAVVRRRAWTAKGRGSPAGGAVQGREAPGGGPAGAGKLAF